MKMSNLVFGSLSLLAALGLIYANLTLPSESLWFDLGYGNMPWAPPIIFAVVGIILLATSTKGESEMSEETPKPTPVIDPAKAALNKNLETAFWGLFLIMLGGQFLLKNANLPEGIWDVGIGLIFLGLNAARYFNGLKMSGFTTFLGILALVGGLAQMFFKFDLGGALLLIVLGAYLILKPWFDRQGLFGKAEES
ncbi:MAG: hypothetical protein HY864_03230 [Chloroflexi bacterium]|nr:hypothetical protein [Chloroflexota bacterium]